MRNQKTHTNHPAAARGVARVENLEDRQYRAAHPIGINVNDSSSNAFDVAVPQLKKLGVTDVRLWYGIDQWSDRKMEGGLKRAVDYHNAGFDVTLTIAIDDKKVPDPADVKGWFKWAMGNDDLRQAVDFWQVGNEVDSDNYFKGTLSEYVSHFLKPAYNVLHANGEKVISGSVSWNPQDVQSMIDNGMLDYCDAVGYHPYAKGVSLQKLRIQQIHDVVDGRKPIVATEWNIRGYENNKSQWAEAVGDAYGQVRSGFALDFYFAMFTVNTPAGPAGLMSNKGVLNQAFYNQFLTASKGVGSSTPPSTGGGTNTPAATDTKIALYNADTDSVISGYTNLKTGQIIDLAKLPTRNLAIVVLPTSNAGSVKMTYNGTTKIENTKPYALFGDNGGNLNGKKIAAGSYSLSVQPFSKDNATGTAYAKSTIDFKLTDSGKPTAPPTGGTNTSAKAEVKAFALVDARTGKAIKGYSYLTSNTSISLAALPTRNLALIALTDEDTRSVKLSINGAAGKVENTLPYAFFGDNNGKYATWKPTKGTYTFAATAYDTKNGKGTMGNSLSITLKFA